MVKKSGITLRSQGFLKTVVFFQSRYNPEMSTQTSIQLAPWPTILNHTVSVDSSSLTLPVKPGFSVSDENTL